MMVWVQALAPIVGAGALAAVAVVWLRRRFGGAGGEDWMGDDGDGGGDGGGD